MIRRWRTDGLFLTAALSAAVLGLAASPALAGTLDQSQTDPSGGAYGMGSTYGGPTRASGETFTAGLSGSLDQADLYLLRNCALSGDSLSVQLRTVSGSPALPTSTVLAAASVPSASIPVRPSDGGWVTALFPAPATVNAGTQYALVATSGSECDLGTFHFMGYSWGCVDKNPYPGGTAVFGAGTWTSVSGDDLAFKTYVVSGGGSQTATGTTATGQRAAALKKCKKKRGAARRKCKRSANRLPV